MNELLGAVAAVLIATFAAGLWRVAHGPTVADRLVATQVLGSVGIAVLLLLAEITGERGPRDAALVFALLALVVTLAFVRQLAPRFWKGREDDE